MLKPEPMCFLIADITGYTSYLAGVELDHAQDILADLVGTVVTSLRPTFRLSKLEGDAAFMVAPTARIDGSLLLDAVERCYVGFRRRRRDVRQSTTCECNACVRIPDLNLKFVVHHGIAVRQRMAGREELLGADVVVTHRLLKNDVVGSTGIPAYALLSQACIDATDIDPVALGMRSHVEAYEHVGEIAGWIHDLEARWQDEESRRREFVRPEDAIVTVDAVTPAPPSVVWEYLTVPGRRRSWQSDVTDVIVDGPGNRRGLGATNHCMHGKDAVVEEILDWRPYDYFTDRSTIGTPLGTIRIRSTMELEPTAEGTIVHARFEAPSDPAERVIAVQVAPNFRSMFEADARTLVEQLGRAVAETTDP